MRHIKLHPPHVVKPHLSNVTRYFPRTKRYLTHITLDLRHIKRHLSNITLLAWHVKRHPADILLDLSNVKLLGPGSGRRTTHPSHSRPARVGQATAALAASCRADASLGRCST